MTRAGYIFTGINVVLAVIFGLLLSVVATTRSDGQKRVANIQKQIADAKAALVKAESDRARLLALLVDRRQILASENRSGDALKSEWDNRLTATTDLLQDARERSNLLKQTLSEIQNEVTARAEEVKTLQGDLAERNTRFEALANRNRELTGQLASVEKQLREVEAKIASDFKAVANLEASGGDRRVADARN